MFNREIVERGCIDTPNTQTHDRALSCLGTGTSIENGGIISLKPSKFRIKTEHKMLSKEILLFC